MYSFMHTQDDRASGQVNNGNPRDDRETSFPRGVSVKPNEVSLTTSGGDHMPAVPEDACIRTVIGDAKICVGFKGSQTTPASPVVRVSNDSTKLVEVPSVVDKGLLMLQGRRQKGNHVVRIRIR